MKKVILITLGLLVILGCVGIMGCSSGKVNETTAAQTQSNQPGATTSSTKTVSGNSGSWRDMPIYPGSKEYFKISSDEDETVNDKPAVYESRMYETSANKDDVVAYYKDKMAANGWTEKSWMELGSEGQESSMGEYEKNGGDNIAVVQISDTDKGTLIKLDTKYPK
jgi:hypothetical protein